MKYLIFLILSACTSHSDEVTCDYRFTNYCHTKAEWDEISKRNWEGIACLDKFFKGKAWTSELQAKAYKKCKMVEVGSLGIL